MNILKQIYEIYEYLFYRTYIWQLRLWGEKRSPEVAGLLLPTSLFTFVFVGPIVGVLHSLEVQNNEELGILLAVIFTLLLIDYLLAMDDICLLLISIVMKLKKNNDNV